MEKKNIIQPLTAKIMEEADQESVKEMVYVKEHMEELKKLSIREMWKTLTRVRKA